MTKITIYNTQKSLKLSKNRIKEVVRAIFESENITCDEIVLNFVDKRTISNLHKKYFDDPSPTDCISFPIDSPNEEGHVVLGEVFICPKTAIEYAENKNLNFYDETTLYIVHSILHLIGYNDITKKDKTIMRKKEKSIMNILKEKKLNICEK